MNKAAWAMMVMTWTMVIPMQAGWAKDGDPSKGDETILADANLLPSREAMIERWREKQKKDEALRDAATRELGRKQLTTIAKRMEEATEAFVYWNVNHQEGELNPHARLALAQKGYDIEPLTSSYYADDCDCTASWGCTHSDPVDRRTFTYYRISW